MCISNKIGPPVEGDDFFGREKEIQKANRLLDSSHSLLLSAPRRIGKSSLAKRLIEEKRIRDGNVFISTWKKQLQKMVFLTLLLKPSAKMVFGNRSLKECPKDWLLYWKA